MKRCEFIVQHWVDRDGRAHCYFRRRGFPRVRLPGLPWSPSFMAAYEAALAGPRTAIGAGRINAAGLPKHCSAHGLRKAACRRLAEGGCSANEIASISGHASLDEVARYTKAADQARLARNALAKAVIR
jgi:integrase